MTDIQKLLLTAPDAQLFRTQLVYAAIVRRSYAEACGLLIQAAVETQGTDWSGQCMQLAETCFTQCQDDLIPNRKVLVAALLGIAGQRLETNATEINAAVYLANVHLDRGHSAAKALAEGLQCLQNTNP